VIVWKLRKTEPAQIPTSECLKAHRAECIKAKNVIMRLREEMRFDLNNPHLLIEPIYGDVLITFKDARIADEDHIAKIERYIMEIVDISPGTMVTLDFKNVRFMSSSCLGFLLKFHKTVAQCQGKLKLRNMSKQIYEIFKITSLHKVFKIEKS
jgi:anti-anti-sigma factor